jgi:hypothetical protein
VAGKKAPKFEDIAEEVLKNAREDRERALEQVKKLNGVFDIDVKDAASMNAAMLVGGSLVKLLEQLTRSNEQLVRVAQIKERQESKLVQDSSRPVDLSELMASRQEEDESKEPSH